MLSGGAKIEKKSHKRKNNNLESLPKKIDCSQTILHLWEASFEKKPQFYVSARHIRCHLTETGEKIAIHSLIRGIFIQSCSAGAKNFTNYVFCHHRFSGVIQNMENRCAILTLFVDYHQNNQFYIVKNEFLKFCSIGTIIFGTLAWTIELYMTK